MRVPTLDVERAAPEVGEAWDDRARWGAAMAFFTTLAHETALDTVQGHLHREENRGERADGAGVKAPVQRWLYAKLLKSEQSIWERYLEGRLRKREWDTEGFLARLRALPHEALLQVGRVYTHIYITFLNVSQ